MNEYRIYRHPLRGYPAVKNSILARLSGHEDRLLSAGYDYSGAVAADSAHDALSYSAEQDGNGNAAQVEIKGLSSGLQVAFGAIGLVLLLGLALSFKDRFGKTAAPEPAAEAAAPVAKQPETQLSAEGFTQWMPYARASAWGLRLDSTRFRVVAVEGRWQGESQCRVQLAPAPADQHWTAWWCARTPDEFTRLSNQYVLAGYRLVQQQSYTDANGQEWQSGVWHKEAK